eukprot:6201742-Pleurochrysis_carterae.AAC.2
MKGARLSPRRREVGVRAPAKASQVLVRASRASSTSHGRRVLHTETPNPENGRRACGASSPFVNTWKTRVIKTLQIVIRARLQAH